jgi:DNA-binding MarR family transcriptional regulator
MLEDELHYLLLATFSQSSRGINDEARKLGLTPGQPKVLEYLLEHDGGEAREICRMFGLDRSTVASILLRMEKRGLVRRTDDADDRRVQHIWLTDEGRKLAKDLKERILAFDERFWKGIPQEDLEATRRVLGQLGKVNRKDRADGR